MARVVPHNGRLSVRIIIIQKNNFWIASWGGQITNRVSRGNINGIWDFIRGIVDSCVRVGLSSVVMLGRFKYGIQKPTGNGLPKQS